MENVIQVDAISMQQHEKANKKNVTRVVSGVKNASRAATVKIVGPRLSKWIAEKYTEKIDIPGKVISHSEVIPETHKTVMGAIEQEELRNLTIGDIIGATNKNGDVIASHVGIQGTKAYRSKDILRGLSVKYNGEIISATTAQDKVARNFTDYVIPNISLNDNLFERAAEIISKSNKYTVSADDLMQSILNSPDPNKALLEFISGTNPLLGRSVNDTPYGWLITDSGAEGIVSQFTRPYEVIIPEHTEISFETLEGYHFEYYNPAGDSAIRKAENILSGYLYSCGTNDLYEVLRRTDPRLSDRMLRLSRADNKRLRTRIIDNFGFQGTKKHDSQMFKKKRNQNSRNEGR